MQENTKSFYEILQEKSPDLTAQLDLLKKRGLEVWLPMIHFDRGSHSGYPHIRNVERNADKLVPDNIKQEFSAGEIFLLLSSIFLHDIGKVVLDNFYGESRKVPCPAPIDSGACGNIRVEDAEGKKDPFCKDLKTLHIYYGEKIIRESWGMLGLPDERIAEYCATVVYCHGLDFPPDIKDGQYPCSKNDDIKGNYKNTSLEPYGRLRIPLIASIIRLADETDNCWMRSVASYWLKNTGEDCFNTLVKAFRRWVEDVEFCHQGQCIIMHIPELKSENMEWPFSKAESDSLTRCRKEICKVLEVWSQPLNDEGIAYNHVFFEYQGCLFNALAVNKTRSLKKQKFTEIFENHSADTKNTIREIVKSLIRLSLGSMGYDRFRWRSLEASVGHTLTERDKWLVQCLSAASGGVLRVEFIPGDNEYIKVWFHHSNVKKIYRAFDIKEETHNGKQ